MPRCPHLPYQRELLFPEVDADDVRTKHARHLNHVNSDPSPGTYHQSEVSWPDLSTTAHVEWGRDGIGDGRGFHRGGSHPAQGGDSQQGVPCTLHIHHP